MKSEQRIVICPLDWGLGHATRCIPLIHGYLKDNAKVIIAADGRPLALLKEEFPTLEFIQFKGYTIQYPANGSMVMNIMFSLPKIFAGIYKEHQQLKKIIEDNDIDIVISDNRFGLWNTKIKSIFLTHQLMIKSPFGEKFLRKINLFFINKYDECWVPDVEGKMNLSGDLAHKYPLPINAKYIGILSRFSNTSSSHLTPPLLLRGDEGVRHYDIMAIISGPEPQRSIFEKIITEQFIESGLKGLIVCGKTEGNKEKIIKGNVEIVSHLETNELQEAIINSKIIIARSGYSTIMDLATLEKKVIFIPTPGQTEQEYLAEKFRQEKIAYYQTQSEFNLKVALIESEKYSGFIALK